MSTQGIYTGTVRHRRFTPVAHTFRYRLCMLFLDVEQIDATIGDSWLHSARRAALLRYRREDFLGDPSQPLADCVRNRVQRATGNRPAGPVMLLANLRWFGLLMNPIACYYCYEADGTTLAAVVAEVTNTPWDERHAYVLPASVAMDDHRASDCRAEARPTDTATVRTRKAGHAEDALLQARFDKALHVSPFNPMDMQYRWSSCTPGDRLAIHLETHREGSKVFDATLSLRREPLSQGALTALLGWRYPLMTLRIAGAIYFEAMRLFMKRAPFYPNTRTLNRPEEAPG